MSEKAQTDETIVLRAGQRKTRMAKAELPEPQSSGCYPARWRSDGWSVIPRESRSAHEIRPEESGALSTLSTQPARPARHRWDQRGERGA